MPPTTMHPNANATSVSAVSNIGPCLDTGGDVPGEYVKGGHEGDLLINAG